MSLMVSHHVQQTCKGADVGGGHLCVAAAGVDGRMMLVLHCKTVLDTSSSHTEVTPTNIYTLTRLLDMVTDHQTDNDSPSSTPC